MPIDFKKHEKFARKITISMICIILMLLNVPLLAILYGMKITFFVMSSSIYHLLHNYFYAAQFGCSALIVKTRLQLLNASLLGFVS